MEISKPASTEGGSHPLPLLKTPHLLLVSLFFSQQLLTFSVCDCNRCADRLQFELTEVSILRLPSTFFHWNDDQIRQAKSCDYGDVNHFYHLLIREMQIFHDTRSKLGLWSWCIGSKSIRFSPPASYLASWCSQFAKTSAVWWWTVQIWFRRLRDVTTQTWSPYFLRDQYWTILIQKTQCDFERDFRVLHQICIRHTQKKYK